VPLLKQVLEKYPNDVKLVFKNFPLSSHKFAFKASVAAMAAHRQGKFWQYHDAVFANYNKLNDRKLDDLAKEVGLDLEKFKKDINDPMLKKKVQQDQQEGVDAGVRGTPTIFINGRRLQQRNLAGFSAMIDSELKKK
jgi:protein-disulfide isomerase